ncbi:MAG: FkbM family methyltransferase [Spirochaetaceae bacterium]|jgi:FkbM family methyltransferase|nr:FkbM family methyltransferase [Spirochaetaceae bacterium]
MKKLLGFKCGALERARQNKSLTLFWQNVFPEKIRFCVYQMFSLLSSDYEKLTTVLISILEDKNNSFQSEKHNKALHFLKKNKIGVISPEFRKIWLEKKQTRDSFFNFNGALIPYWPKVEELRYVFLDTFLFSVLLNDDYSAKLVEKLEEYMPEGPYSYQDKTFDVTVKHGDIVVDAGAWIGDFSAYAAAKGAISYAFEPTNETFKMLENTAHLNSGWGGGGIYPVQKGLGEFIGEVMLSVDTNGTGESNSIINKNKISAIGTEKIKITTLDAFVHEQNIKKIDFIKADIEGAERDMLKGANNVLKEFAPKMALCTYHLPDDPVVMEALIKDANPNYKVVHTSKKLFAACQ